MAAAEDVNVSGHGGVDVAHSGFVNWVELRKNWVEITPVIR